MQNGSKPCGTGSQSQRARIREPRPKRSRKISLERTVCGFIGWLVGASRQVGNTMYCPLTTEDERAEDQLVARAEVDGDTVKLSFLCGDSVLHELKLERRSLRRFGTSWKRNGESGFLVRYHGAAASEIRAVIEALDSRPPLAETWAVIRRGNFPIPAPIPA
jgi:hypothetical protein